MCKIKNCLAKYKQINKVFLVGHIIYQKIFSNKEKDNIIGFINAVQYSTVQYNTVQYSTVQNSTVQYRILQCCDVLYNSLILISLRIPHEK